MYTLVYVFVQSSFLKGVLYTKLRIPKIAYANPDINSNDLMVYINLLCMYCSSVKDDIVFDIGSLCYFIYNTVSPGRRAREALSSSIEHLIESELLYGEQIDKTHYRISKKSFSDDGVGFVIINSSELLLLNNEGADILHYWCYLVSTLNNDTKYGYASRGYFSDNLNVSEKTIGRYNDKLIDIGILSTERKWTSKNKSILIYRRT